MSHLLIPPPMLPRKVPTKIIMLPSQPHIGIRSESSYNAIRKFPMPIVNLPQCGHSDSITDSGSVPVQSIVKEPFDTINLNEMEEKDINSATTSDLPVKETKPNKFAKKIRTGTTRTDEIRTSISRS
jgi:hypothetical protein